MLVQPKTTSVAVTKMGLVFGYESVCGLSMILLPRAGIGQQETSASTDRSTILVISEWLELQWPDAQTGAVGPTCAEG